MSGDKEYCAVNETQELWSELRKLGNFRDSAYDEAILDELKAELQIPKDADLDKEIGEHSKEALLEAFFRVTAPLTAMYTDILKLFESCRASRSGKNIVIAFEPDRFECEKFNIEHFMIKKKEPEPLKFSSTHFSDAKRTLERAKTSLDITQEEYRIRGRRRAYLITKDSVNGFKACLDKLLSLSDTFGNRIVADVFYTPSDASVKRWLDSYWDCDDRFPPFLPDFSSLLNAIEGGEQFQVLVNFWMDMLEVCKSANYTRANWCAGCLSKDGSDYNCPNICTRLLCQKVDDETGLFYGESVKQLGDFLKKISNVIDYYDILSENRKAQAQWYLSAFRDSLEFGEDTTNVLCSVLKDYLSLPVWAHRYEVYSVWVFTRILHGLRGAQIQFHIQDDTLSFPFSGACLAEVRFNNKTYQLWTELRTKAIGKLWGRGRQAHIQPDYSIVCGDFQVASDSVTVVECKQYKKSNPANFGKAVLDYANNRPNARVLLANYGPIVSEGVVKATKNLSQERYGLFPLCRPESESALALSNEIRTMLYRDSGLYLLDPKQELVITLSRPQGVARTEQHMLMMYQEDATKEMRYWLLDWRQITGIAYSCEDEVQERIVIQHFQPGTYYLFVYNCLPCAIPVVSVSTPDEGVIFKQELPQDACHELRHVLTIDGKVHTLKFKDPATK